MRFIKKFALRLEFMFQIHQIGLSCPTKMNFSCERLENDISRFDPTKSYLIRVLEGSSNESSY